MLTEILKLDVVFAIVAVTVMVTDPTVWNLVEKLLMMAVFIGSKSSLSMTAQGKDFRATLCSEEARSSNGKASRDIWRMAKVRWSAW